MRKHKKYGHNYLTNFILIKNKTAPSTYQETVTNTLKNTK